MLLPQALWLLGLPVACAAIGFLLGRLIRERPTEVERKRPRIAGSTAYLRDARNRNLSPHSRIRCSFDAIYLCCAELAEMHGHQLDAVCHPTHEVVRIGLAAINATEGQLRAAESLADWVVTGSPQMPSVSILTAFELARSVRERTIEAFRTAETTLHGR